MHSATQFAKTWLLYSLVTFEFPRSRRVCSPSTHTLTTLHCPLSSITHGPNSSIPSPSRKSAKRSRSRKAATPAADVTSEAEVELIKGRPKGSKNKPLSEFEGEAKLREIERRRRRAESTKKSKAKRKAALGHPTPEHENDQKPPPSDVPSETEAGDKGEGPSRKRRRLTEQPTTPTAVDIPLPSLPQPAAIPTVPAAGPSRLPYLLPLNALHPVADYASLAASHLHNPSHPPIRAASLGSETQAQLRSDLPVAAHGSETRGLLNVPQTQTPAADPGLATHRLLQSSPAPNPSPATTELRTDRVTPDAPHLFSAPHPHPQPPRVSVDFFPPSPPSNSLLALLPTRRPTSVFAGVVPSYGSSVARGGAGRRAAQPPPCPPPPTYPVCPRSPPSPPTSLPWPPATLPSTCLADESAGTLSLPPSTWPFHVFPANSVSSSSSSPSSYT
ncbi:hypothetical protein BXZ70DRAFT_1012434 [Cristinia sonorae]|uniref:Uncharacterized protein n=1 Tax=Cristinia sonorae TaxID=1940300 RepID=A0A8K0UEI2_9AGAR|nr:hypothetical protein BXZ70DRAFT_1012434 [Cristinia sonorae]